MNNNIFIGSNSTISETIIEIIETYIETSGTVFLKKVQYNYSNTLEKSKIQNNIKI